MKKNILLASFVLMSVFAFAQEWQLDLKKAKEMAKENGQKIILVFQGSDWCAPCMKLDEEIWSTEEFKEYAKDNYIMLQADFPKRKGNRLSKEQQEKNNQLAEKYNQQGYFPHVVVLDSSGKMLGQTGYKKMTVEAYIELLNSFGDKN